ncbi:hypothetical protein Pcinc_036862, partial [Petrolisthes cinctipes]
MMWLEEGGKKTKDQRKEEGFRKEEKQKEKG